MDGSTSRFLRDFFLYWPLVSPYPSGHDDEYEKAKVNNERGEGVEGAKKSEDETKDSRSPVQACLSMY